MRFLLILVILIAGAIIVSSSQVTQEVIPVPSSSPSTPSPTLKPQEVPPSPPTSVILQSDYHVFQTFNNCGPAALSMALSYFDIKVSQEKLGQELRPYQNPKGDNDDKSVTLSELAKKATEYNLLAYHRPAGSMEKVKRFIASDIPVITRTWLKPNEDIGHYRVIKGYDDTRGAILQDDSLQDKNLWFTYDEYNKMWDKFNYEYLVLVRPEKKAIAEQILGEDVNEQRAWQKAKDMSLAILSKTEDLTARFNLSVAEFHLGNYQASVNEIEKVQSQLPFRTLWYQIEPLEAYYHLGMDDKFFSLSNSILQNHNRAYSEVYILRGKAYLRQGKTNEARQEFEKAVLYNKNLKEAQEALSLL